MQHPSISSAILLSPVEDGYVAYDTKADRIHRMNATAALLVELCDGKRTREEICDLVAPVCADAGEIETWFDEALQAGLLAPDFSDSGFHVEMTSDELAELAERLRECGKVEAAFLCQQRATELDENSASRWCQLGELAHIAGRRQDARAAYERCLELDPDNSEVRHLLVSLRGDTPPDRMPDECLRQLYARFANFYDENMCDELDYQGPEILGGMIDQQLNDAHDLAILDLGCGTGLMGQRLRARAHRLVGIDLSAEMVEKARRRNVYDELVVAEITDWLCRNTERFDLVVACDTFIYFGDLRQTVVPVGQYLKPCGLFAFSVEHGDAFPFTLTDSGRYRHHPNHIRDAASAAGLAIDRMSRCAFRWEYGHPVQGHFVTMKCDLR